MRIAFVGITVLVCFVVSILFCVVSWMMTVKNKSKSIWASCCSLSFVAITLLLEYRAVLDWVNKEDWAALADVVPSMFSMLSGYVILLIFANAFSITKTIRKR